MSGEVGPLVTPLTLTLSWMSSVTIQIHPFRSQAALILKSRSGELRQLDARKSGRWSAGDRHLVVCQRAPPCVGTVRGRMGGQAGGRESGKRERCKVCPALERKIPL